MAKKALPEMLIICSMKFIKPRCILSATPNIPAEAEKQTKTRKISRLAPKRQLRDLYVPGTTVRARAQLYKFS